MLYPNHVTEDYSYYKRTDLATYGCHTTGGNPVSPLPPAPNPLCECDRDCKNTKEELVRVKFLDMHSLRKAEPWWKGALELEVYTLYLDDSESDPTEKTKPLHKEIWGKRKQFRKARLFKPNYPIWRNINVEIITFDRETQGDFMQYTWIEIDRGVDVEFKVKTPAFKIFGVKVPGLDPEFKLKAPRVRELLGESVVEYCDDANGEGYKYNTGTLEFYVKQR